MLLRLLSTHSFNTIEELKLRELMGTLEQTIMSEALIELYSNIICPIWFNTYRITNERKKI